jgi:hypothetical protein
MSEIKDGTKVTSLKVLHGIDAQLLIYPDRLVIRRGGGCHDWLQNAFLHINWMRILFI